LILLPGEPGGAFVTAVGTKNWDAIGTMPMLDAPANVEKWTQVRNECKAG
jgi:hypothetical protein